MRATPLRYTPTAVTLLLVDDDIRVLVGLRDVLAFTSSVSVLATASSGEEALALDRALAPDVVVVDVRLPETIDGVRLIRTLHSRGRRIVAVSVVAALDRPAREAGASAFLEKDPHLVDRLIDAVHASAYVD